MKILLIYPPIENEVSHISLQEIDEERGFLPPLGLLYLATYLKKYSNFDVKIIDCNVDSISHNDLPKLIIDFNPDIVGISSMTHFLVDAYKIAAAVKNISNKVITVIGGPHTTIYPITTLENPNVDYTIKGEGELAFYKLVLALQKGVAEEELSSIKGIATKFLQRKGAKDTDIELIRIPDLDTLPIPDRTLLPYKKYYSVLSHSSNIATMITTRGCPYRCIYCDRMGKKYRSTSAEYVLDEIESILSLGIREIFFHDDTFNIEKKRVVDICEAILDKKLKFKWDARARINCADYNQLLLMKRAGCSRISFGVESGNPNVLRNLRKGITLEQVEDVFKWCKELGISSLADFMIGSPGETMKEIQDTIKFAKRLKPDYVQFSIVCPYPDTDLYRLCLENNMIKDDVWLNFSRNPSVDFEPPIWNEHFSRHELEMITKKLFKEFYLTPRFIFNEIKKLRSMKEFKVKMKAAVNLFQS
ncbi:MAG: B12-binding domain-containing radical SAM protein [Candidatus Scalindua sp.]